MKHQNKKLEVAFFDNIARIRNGYENFEDSVYWEMIKSTGAHRLIGKDILDVGCGSGSFGNRLSELGNRTIGVDISKRMVEKGREKANQGFRILQGDIENPDLFCPNKFDVIFCAFILHHLPSPYNVLRNFNWWLKKNGRLFIIEPNGSNPILKVSEIIGRKNIVKNARTINETVHSYKYYKNILEIHGFSITSKRTFHLKEDKYSLLSIKGVLLSTREILLKLTKVLPFPFRERYIVINATKLDLHTYP